MSTPSRKRARAPSTTVVVAPKTTVRRRVTKKAPAVVAIGRQPFPKVLKNSVRYAEVVGITVTTGAGGYAFSCNGLYDPNASGTGHQPLYFDQLMTIYDHYTVTASRCKFTLVTSSSKELVLSAFVDDDGSWSGGVAIPEKPGCKNQVVNPSVSRPYPMYLTWKASDYFPGAHADDSTMQGTASGNPSEQSNYAIAINDIGLTSFTCNVFVEIEYDVEWNEYKDMGPS